MVQDLRARVPAQAGAWGEVRGKAEAGWADHSQQDRAETVCAQAAEQRLLMLPDSHVTQ